MPSITDKITKTTDGSRPLATTVTATRAPGVTTLSGSALTGWESATTAVHFATFSTDANGEVVAGSQCDWKGIVSGNTINNLTLMAGTDNGNSVGDIISPTITAAWGDEMAQAMLLEHKPTGAHDDITATSITVTTSATLPAGSVDTSELANASVTPTKLATGADAAYVAIGENTTSTSYTDLATTTDSITVTVGANGLLLVSLSCLLQNSGANFSSMSFALSGANTLVADVDRSIAIASTARLSGTFLIEGLNAGSTVVKAKYNVSAGTGTFTSRRISAIPL